jgi:hypothetical protein
MDIMLNLMFYGFIAILDSPRKRASPLTEQLSMEFYLNKAPYASRSQDMCISMDANLCPNE